MRDLIDKINVLLEAPVNPGERKEISFKLKKLDAIKKNLDNYRSSLYSMETMSLPDSVKADIEAAKAKLETEIDKVSGAYNEMYERSMKDGRPIKMDNLFRALAKNCREIIKVYKEANNDFRGNSEKFLYRGIRSREDALYGKPFDIRKPKDSDSQLDTLVNDAMKEHGFAATRNNSTFVTGDRSQASGYGHSLYIMFPVDGFKYTWSEAEKDLVLDKGKRAQLSDKKILNTIKDMVLKATAEADEATQKRIKSYIDPDKLFDRDYRILDDLSSIRSLASSGSLPEELVDMTNETITSDGIIEGLKFRDDGLFNALLSNHEIYLLGPYYAVNSDHMRELKRFLREIDVSDVTLPEEFGEAPAIIEKGDIVKITKGEHAGELATIAYTYSSSSELGLTASQIPIDLPNTDFELYKLPDGTYPMPFEDEDLVRVINPKSMYYGKSGRVFYINSNGKLELKTADGDYVEAYKHELDKQYFKKNDKVAVTKEDSPYAGQVGEVLSWNGPGNEVEVRLPERTTPLWFPAMWLTIADDKWTPDTTPKKTPILTDAPIDIGAIVTIDNPTYKGHRAIVVYGPDSDDEFYVKFLTGEKGFSYFPADSLIKLEDAPTLNVGDQVLVKDSYYKGQTGTIESLADATGNFMVRVGTDVEPMKIYRFDKVENPEPDTDAIVAAASVADSEQQGEFKIGDSVMVIATESSKYGQVGTITGFDTNAMGDAIVAIIDFPNSKGFRTFLNWVSKETPAETNVTKKNGFTKGETVKIIDPTNDFAGKVGTITYVYTSVPEVAVKLIADNGEPFIIDFGVEDVASYDAVISKFTVGDTVKITGPSAYNNNSYTGYTGKISSVSDDGNFAGVAIDNEDAILTYNVASLSKSDEEPEVSIPPAKFTEGDIVKVVNKKLKSVGKVGRVVNPDNGGFVEVAVKGNNFHSFLKPEWIELSTDAGADTNTTANTQIHVGDRVKVVNSNLSSYGVDGTVEYIDYSDDSGMLTLKDGNGETYFLKITSVKKI